MSHVPSVDYRERITVPMCDGAGRVVALVDVYGLGWDSLTTIPGLATAVWHVARRVGCDPRVYPLLHKLSPDCYDQRIGAGPCGPRRRRRATPAELRDWAMMIPN